MPKNDVVWRGQTTSTLNLAPCRKVFNLFDHPLARFLKESKRRVVPRLFFPSIHMEIRLFTIWRGVKSFAPRTRIRFGGGGCSKVGEIFHNITDSVMSRLLTWNVIWSSMEKWSDEWRGNLFLKFWWTIIYRERSNRIYSVWIFESCWFDFPVILNKLSM